MLPSLERSNGRTTSVFQMLLIAQARSELREYQLLSYHLVPFFSLIRAKATEKIFYKTFNLSVHILGVCLYVY
jgi:hypothetical protein